MDVWQLAISQLKCNVDFDLSWRVIEAQPGGLLQPGFFIAVIDT